MEEGYNTIGMVNSACGGKEYRTVGVFSGQDAIASPELRGLQLTVDQIFIYNE
jgi:Uma2 family endonuclease